LFDVLLLLMVIAFPGFAEVLAPQIATPSAPLLKALEWSMKP